MNDYRTFIEDGIANNVDSLDDLIILAAVSEGKDTSFVRVAFDDMIETAIQDASINDVLNFHQFVMGVMPSDTLFGVVRDNVYDYIIDKDLRQTLASRALDSEYLTFEKVEAHDMTPGDMVYVAPDNNLYLIDTVENYWFDVEHLPAPDYYRSAVPQHYGERVGEHGGWVRETKPVNANVYERFEFRRGRFYTMLVMGDAPVLDWIIVEAKNFN